MGNNNCSCMCPCNNIGPEINSNPACVSPCWDVCTCMDQILINRQRIDDLESSSDRSINTVNSKVTRNQQTITDNFNSLSRAIGDIAEVIDSKVATEKNRATAAEQAIQLDLDSYKDSNDLALQQESEMRAQEDAVIRESISSLNGDLNDLTDRVDGLEDTIQEEITDRRATIANEAEERRAADALLQQNINNEVTNRINGDDALRQLVLDVDNSLINYYTKSETYTKSEVQQILSNIRQFQYTVAGELPEASVDTIGYIYLIPTSNPVAGDVKDEFITISKEENGAIVYSWEQIGHTAVNLSGYSTTEEMNTAIETALSGYAQTSALSSYATTTQAIGGVSISGNTITFTSVSGVTIDTIELPSLWTDNGTTLSPSTSGRSVTAAGFYDSTIN